MPGEQEKPSVSLINISQDKKHSLQKAAFVRRDIYVNPRNRGIIFGLPFQSRQLLDVIYSTARV